MTQISRVAEMKKISLKGISLEQTARYYRRGSVLGGTIKSGCNSLEVKVDVDSEEPAGVIAELVRVAKESCFAHGSLTDPVEVTASVTLRGKAIDISATTP